MITNLDVAQIIIEELSRVGVTQFIISPGSRSTPLTVAIARHPKAKTVVHYDERGAAFFALGYARATSMPAVLVCTSGTAVANYYPAVIEASMDNIPMIILSADRPPELIDVGANQAIFQQNIYGVYPRLALSLPPPDAGTIATDILTQVGGLFEASTGEHPGPVHLNCQFREPLLPERIGGSDSPTYDSEWVNNNSSDVSGSSTSLPLPAEKLQLVVQSLEKSKRGLIIVGRSVSNVCTNSILHLSETLDLPVFPDVQSKLRFGDHPLVINHFDLALLSDDLQLLKPDFVIHFGRAFTSKRLLDYLDDSNIFYASVKETPERIDPNHQVSIELQTDMKEFCQGLGSNRIDQDDQWLPSWQRIEEQTGISISNLLKDESQISEPGTSYHLSKLVPSNHALMLANSMSIREMEMFASTGHFEGEIFANRGASGIDGLLATAAGYGAGSERPVTILMGDLAFLHDLNSLQLIKTAQQPIIMVVVNNDGGGIFSFLSIWNETDVFEPFFGTPHGLTLEHAASMFGLAYSNPADMDAFKTTYIKATKQAESILIELVTDRIENHRFHQQIFESLRESS
ncbi:MAG: 2-succinyl-5-enolpyruvyl-6-hydroxy-3-cyclohexene-1-carboxylic-acid synthase [Candidatus Marinimicrobia bacterium]|nr:2-succinyl-5-enolpyruvyl-6-hydroxy-3-cyclohexene-1-carboxylic-acid synthase [Candidatus Neomarinimicrobiota bacterium]